MKKLLITFLMGISLQANATLLWYDDFETNNLELNTHTIDNWQVHPTIDTVGPDWWGISTCHSGNVCIDTDGTHENQPGGSIKRLQHFDVGSNYMLTFWISGSQRNYIGKDPFDVIRVSIGDTTTDIGMSWNSPWQAFSMLYTAINNNEHITFESINSDDDVGLLIDDVSLCKLDQNIIDPPDTPTPEPATFMLFGAGLVVIGLFRR